MEPLTPPKIYRSSEECDAVIYMSIGDEPKSYKLSDSALLETNERNWNNIWKEHVEFYDMTLRDIQSENTLTWRSDNTKEIESYIEHMHSKLRSIMLERRIQKLENKS